MKVVVDPEAQEEFLSAQQHYSAASEEPGRRFYDEISGLFRRIISRPLGYKQFDPPARRAFADGFPYAVVYVVAAPDVLWVVAVMHVRRAPGYWKGRLGK